MPAEVVAGEGRRMVEVLEREGLLRLEEGHIRLTRAGKPLVDSVAVALMG
jgi:oxygen-independent coproporphyrinogen III oxidase